MTQTHKLVPIEPTALQVRAGQLGVTTTCAKAIYAAMLASAPEVGEAVDMDENTAKRFRGILSMLGISAPESDESLMLCQFSLLGMMRHKIQQIYEQPDRTAQLEAERDSYKSALEAALEEKEQAKHDETVAVKLLSKEKDKVKRLVDALKASQYYVRISDSPSKDCQYKINASLLAEMEAKK